MKITTIVKLSTCGHHFEEREKGGITDGFSLNLNLEHGTEDERKEGDDDQGGG